PCRWSSSRPITRMGRLMGAIRSSAKGSSMRARTRSGSRICISSMLRRPVLGATNADSSMVRLRNSWLAGSRDAGPDHSGIPRGELEEHLAGMADADVPEPLGIDLRVRGDVAEDSEFILEFQRPSVHQLHALPVVDD